MLIASSGAALGIFNATRAEHSAALLTDRYLVLESPARTLQASIDSFQLTAEQAFADVGQASTFLPSAVIESTATDQAYLVLRRLLAQPADADLAPSLNALEMTYVDSRTGLALLAGTPTALRAAQVAVTERSAYTNVDASLGALESTVDNGLVRAAHQSQVDAISVRLDLIMALALGLVLGVAITAVLTRKALLEERSAEQRDAEQAQLARRSEFEGRLQRALEMAKSETPVFDLVAESLSHAAPEARGELLLADSSRAHFRRVLVSRAENGEGCGVVSPGDCPAASRGQTMVFPLSTAIDACPNLRDRGCSALCVPVSISGNSVGVLHLTSPDGSPPAEGLRRDIEVVARRASERLAMLRAFELSQTQANSDSLTGLLTRRSLEARVRELQESGMQYSVAYCDLDHFKQLNDVFGHEAGDRSLRAFSQTLRDALRPNDLPCRYGGEEFVIVLPGCPLDEAVPVLERMRRSLAMRLTSGRLPTFTVSCGVASSDQAVDFERVVALADESLLRAKAAGRDRIHVAGDAVATVVLNEGAPIALIPSCDVALAV
jgi:diguanylate cyclase (GGDEF)-like protein